MSKPAARVELGRITAVHGLRGAVKLESWTAPRQQIFSYLPWLLELPDGGAREFASVSGSGHDKALRALLPGITERDAALALVGSRIYAPRASLPPAEPGSYYWADLIGLEVVNTSGLVLGHVDHLVATGANDVLVLRDVAGREQLLPFVQERYVKEVDLEAGRIRVDWDPDYW